MQKDGADRVWIVKVQQGDMLVAPHNVCRDCLRSPKRYLEGAGKDVALRFAGTIKGWAV